MSSLAMIPRDILIFMKLVNAYFKFIIQILRVQSEVTLSIQVFAIFP